ncbi:hypothetical protein TNCT_613491 [Trichonephila clavata]|uniref:Uncharacterized protein n=1 Tax=Trichonephila clavata TaxID=2740835 RepID=A0A8X6IYT2_TRICU|nr:hypothetical protein TNCT_613491 [Trichonephila clavata]
MVSKDERPSREGAATESTTHKKESYPIRCRTAPRGMHFEESSTTGLWKEFRRQPYNQRSRAVTWNSGFSSRRQFVTKRWNQWIHHRSTSLNGSPNGGVLVY